jgi:Glycosyl hydrolase catalytic core
VILGHMIQGDWVADEGSTYQPVSVYFELLRLWDSRAVWHKMETDLTALGANIRFAQSRNAKVMFTFGEPPDSAFAPSYKKVPTMEAWEAFVRRVISEGKGRIDVYEGWNEPMYPEYWDATPEMLVPYQRRLFQLCQEFAPGKIVLSPSFVRVELPDGKDYLNRFKAAGGLEYCDAVAWHGYCEKSADLRGQVASLKTFTDKPLWNTEYVVGTGLSQMKDSLMLQSALGVQCAVWNAEILGSDDYTDPTMQQVHDQLTSLSARKGCFR